MTSTILLHNLLLFVTEALLRLHTVTVNLTHTLWRAIRYVLELLVHTGRCAAFADPLQKRVASQTAKEDEAAGYSGDADCGEEEKESEANTEIGK